jgi:hypothetical protein
VQVHRALSELGRAPAALLHHLKGQDLGRHVAGVLCGVGEREFIGPREVRSTDLTRGSFLEVVEVVLRTPVAAEERPKLRDLTLTNSCAPSWNASPSARIPLITTSKAVVAAMSLGVCLHLQGCVRSSATPHSCFTVLWLSCRPEGQSRAFSVPFSAPTPLDRGAQRGRTMAGRGRDMTMPAWMAKVSACLRSRICLRSSTMWCLRRDKWQAPPPTKQRTRQR